MRRQTDLPLAAIVAGIAAAMVPALARVALTVPLRVPLDSNEGWNAYHTVHAFAGGLYTPLSRFFFNVYPPLSFYIVGAAGAVTGDPIAAGRAIACLAFIALAGVLAAAARQMGCTRTEAAFGGVLFLAVTLALSHYVGIDDPQFLGQAVVSAGLLFVLREPRTAARLWTGAAVMTAGIFVKHSNVALPLVASAWALRFDPPAGRRLLLVGSILAFASLLISLVVFGSGFLDVLTTPRAYVLGDLPRLFGRWIIRVPVVLAASYLLVRRFPNDRHVMFSVSYVVVASMVGLLMLAGAGVDWNAMFESNWACCLLAGVALNRLTPARAPGVARRRRLQLALAFVALPVVATGIGARRAWRSSDYWLRPRANEAAAASRDILSIADRPGRAFCEELSLCFWAGKPAEIDVFNLQQHLLNGSRDTEDVVRRFRNGDFAVVQMHEVAPLFGPTFLDVLNARYVMLQQRPSSVLYVRRP